MYLLKTIVQDINLHYCLHEFFSNILCDTLKQNFILRQRILIITGRNSDGNRSQFPIVSERVRGRKTGGILF